MPTNPAPVEQLTAVIERENDAYVALCPELDVASQGDTIEEARRNLQEAVQLFLEAAAPSEIEVRLHSEVDSTEVRMSTVKQQVRELADRLPEDATWEQVRYEIYVRAKIAEGAKALAEGRTIPHEEVVKRLATWL